MVSMDERSISLSGLARVQVLAGQEILGRPCRTTLQQLMSLRQETSVLDYRMRFEQLAAYLPHISTEVLE